MLCAQCPWNFLPKWRQPMGLSLFLFTSAASDIFNKGPQLPCLWGASCTAEACAALCHHRNCITILNKRHSYHWISPLSRLSMGDHEARSFPLFQSEHYSGLSHTTLTGAKDLLRKLAFVEHEGDDILSFFRTRLYSWSLLSRKYNLRTGHTTLLPAF